jgi:hypothetical protein
MGHAYRGSMSECNFSLGKKKRRDGKAWRRGKDETVVQRFFPAALLAISACFFA